MKKTNGVQFDSTIKDLTGLIGKRADEYEIFCSRNSGLSIEVKDGRVEALKARSSIGVGLRTVSEGRPGFAYSSVIDDKKALADMVDAAVSGAKGAAPDPLLSFPAKSVCVSEPKDLFDAAYNEATEDEKVDIALRIENAARGFDKRINRVRKASYGETLAVTRTVNSKGVDVSYKATFFNAAVTAVAEENGSSEMGWEVMMGHERGDIKPEGIGVLAAKRAVELLGARPISGSINCPVIFENTIVMEFLDAIAGSFLSESVQKGRSMLAEKKGEKVMSGSITLVDDGTFPGGWSTSAYDCEGVVKRKTRLISGGVLENYLYDTYRGKKDGVPSTGNAVRGGFKGVPSVGVTNLYLEKGEKSLDELIKSVSKGLLIKDVMGMHTVDPVSGEFSVGASGVWIENGEIAYPVRGIAIAGNLLELFSSVGEVGGDLRFMGSVGAPSVLFTSIHASGS